MRTRTNRPICFIEHELLQWEGFQSMASKEVASALSVLTSDGFERCQEWSDNCAIEALIADYFTGSGNITECEESSDNDHSGMSVISL